MPDITGAARPIAVRQNDPAMLRLLRAAAVSHQRARWLEALRGGISVALAIGGVVAVLQPALAPGITVAGGLWAVTYATGLASWSRDELRRAALLQEMFDVRLFELRWNEVAAGEPIGAEEVARLSRRFRGPDAALRDWYQSANLPRPNDLLACQLQNLSWGARVRRRYARAVLLAVLAWSATGLAVGLLAGLTLAELVLRWYVPSLGALLYGVDIFRVQRHVAGERDRVLAILRDRITGTGTAADLLVLARLVQDFVLHIRREHVRVPDWFYRHFRARDQRDFELAVAELEQAVRPGASRG